MGLIRIARNRRTRPRVQHYKNRPRSREEGRNRSPKFTRKEKILLNELVIAFPEATNTCHNAVGNEDKKLVWDVITEAFNELSSFHYVKVKDLKNLFFTIKEEQKTEELEDINVTSPRGGIELDHVESNINYSKLCNQILSDHTELINDTLTWFPDGSESTWQHARQCYQRMEIWHQLIAIKENLLLLNQKKARLQILLLEALQEGGSD